MIAGRQETCSRVCKARCCQGPSPTLTVFDVARILRYIQASPRDLTNYFEIYTHSEYTENILPTRTGTRLSRDTLRVLRERLGDLYESLLIIKLRKREDNSCIFLTEDYRCSIYPVRPLGCRAYPLKVTGVDEECLLVKYGFSLEEEQRYLKMYLEELFRHYRMLVSNYIDSIEKLVRAVELVWSTISI